MGGISSRRLLIVLGAILAALVLADTPYTKEDEKALRRGVEGLNREGVAEFLGTPRRHQAREGALHRGPLPTGGGPPPRLGKACFYCSGRQRMERLRRPGRRLDALEKIFSPDGQSVGESLPGQPPPGAAGEFCLRAGRGSVRRSEPRGASGDSPRRMEAAPRAERVLDPPPFQDARGWGAERRGFRSLRQAASHGLYSDFFAALAGAARAFKKPVLFLHGQFHAWEVQRGFLAKNITRVMAAGGSAPPPRG